MQSVCVLQAEDKQLLKEVGKGGEGAAEEVHQLIDEVSTLIPPISNICTNVVSGGGGVVSKTIL